MVKVGAIMFKNDEKFSKAHPITSKVEDTEIFFHGTSSKRFLSMQSSGFLKRSVSDSENYTVSQAGTICFERYIESCKRIIDENMRRFCEAACNNENDGSTEGVILKITGRNLKRLGCPIYADWNYGFSHKRDSQWLPFDVDYSGLGVTSIIVTDCDIPIEYLELAKRIPITLKSKDRAEKRI